MLRTLPAALLLAALAAPAVAATNDTAIDAATLHLIHLDATGALPVDPEVGLDVVDVRAWRAGSFVRFAQSVRGVPVEGQDVVVALDTDGLVRRVVGTPIADADLDLQPRVAEANAIAAADRLVGGFFGDEAPWPSRAALRAFTDREGVMRLVWAVDASSAEPFGTWRVLVDAHDGEVVRFGPTHHTARAEIYLKNPDSSEITDVELPRLTSDTALEGEHGLVVSCETWTTGGLGGGECTKKRRLAAPDGDGNYYFEPAPTSVDDPFAEVQMYYHLDKVAQYFADHHGFTHRTPIEAIVNFPLNNAFFGDADGDRVEEIAFGQTSTIDFAYDGDVVYHEFVHSVFASVATAGFFGADEYGVDYAPMSLNEGSADLFSLVITGDPLLGEYAGKGFGSGAIRDMEPDRSCPGSLYGESHEDGMIWGAMGWNLIDDPQVGPDVVSDLVFGVLEQLGDAPSWASAGDTLVSVAGDLLDAGAIDTETHAAILGHAEAAGVPGCERIIPLDDGATPTLFGLYAGVADDLGWVPLTAQLSLDAPENATEVRFRIDDLQASTNQLGWTVFVRRGDFVHHEVRTLFGFDVPLPTTYDVAFDGERDGYELVLDATSSPALVPGATYYFSVGTRNLGGIGGFDLAYGDFTFSGEVTAPEPEPDPIDEGEDIARACGCASAPAGAGWGLLVPLLALVRRRR